MQTEADDRRERKIHIGNSVLILSLHSTANCNDECPDDPPKITPGQCDCGMADVDDDGDGSVIGDFITAEPGLDDKDGKLVDFLNRFRKKMHF